MGIIGKARSNFNRPLLERISGKKVPYPLFEEKENEITAINGEKSFNFELHPNDLEQMDNDKLKNCYNNLKDSLNSIQEEDWFKFYRIGKKVFFSVKDEAFSFLDVSVSKLSNPTTQFFGTEPFSNIDFYESYLTVNTKYWRLINLQIPPANSYESFLDDFREDYVVIFKKIGNEKAKHVLGQKRRTQGNALDTTHQNHLAEASYGEANNLLHDITVNGEGLFKVAVWFIVKADTIEKLNFRTHELVNDLKSKRATAFVETSSLDYFFNHLIIGIPPSFLKATETNASYLANLIPYHLDKLHTQGLELSSRNGNQIKLDLYYELASNQNWLITGESGQGKSFLGATLMSHLHSQGVKIGVFDLGGSLRRMALYLGGVDLGEQFNPLQFKCPHYLKKFILAVIGESEYSKEKKGKLFERLKYHLEDGKIKRFKQLIQVLNEYHDFKDIYYHFNELWDCFTDEIIELPNIFYIDTKNRPKEIVAPYLIFARELCEQQEGKMALFYDECWDIVDKCPDIIRINAKTGRKDLIANVFLTQEIVELDRDYNNVANAIIGNTYGKIYFHQPNLEHKVIKSFQKEVISDVISRKGEYSEFVFCTVDHTKICRLIATPLFYELCNSEKEHVQSLNNFIDSHEGILSYRESINKWVEVLYV